MNNGDFPYFFVSLPEGNWWLLVISGVILVYTECTGILPY